MKLAADNLHGLNPAVIDAFERLDPEPITIMVRQFEQAGVDLIDINPGRLSRKREDRIAFMIETVQSASRLRLILDSPDPRLLEIGLEVVRDRPIVSALSMEPHKLERILPLAKKYDAELIILLMDENSFTPATVDEKIALSIILRDACLKQGLKSEDLIFDPILPNLTWQDARFRLGEIFKTVRLLSSGAVFQESVRTMCGLSNIRSGVRRLFTDDYETQTMAALAGAGLDILLANALAPKLLTQFSFLKQIID